MSLPFESEISSSSAKLTVCICVRNGQAYLDRCLTSLMSQDRIEECEVVVVDHLSTDATSRILQVWKVRHPRLQIDRCELEGLANARNFAWQQSRTPWVGFIDVDCKARSGWVRSALRGIEVHQTNQSAAAFGGNNFVPRDLGRIYSHFELLLSTYVGGHSSILNREIKHQLRLDHIPTLNVVYRRSALERVGGFDPAYSRVAEDIDLSLRLTRSGYSLWSHPGMEVEHALRPSVPAWIRNMFLYGRGRCYFTKRHPRAFELKFLAPLAIVGVYLAVLGGSFGHPFGAIGLSLVVLGHLGACLLALAPTALRRSVPVRLWVGTSLLALATHLAYGLGEFYELPRSSRRFD